jgi:glycerol-3-phosphate acyltransferase PlsY
MNGIGSAALLVAIGYLLGAIPFGLLVARATAGIDPRTAGSGRIGATNVLRTVGRTGAAAVFLLDLAKGLLAVLLARWLFAGPEVEWVAAAAGTAAVIGHVRSIFIGFGGGRGVATSTGALLGLAPLVVAIVAPVVIAIVWRTRYVSLGSISGALLAPLVAALLTLIGLASIQVIAYAVSAGGLIVVAHGDNITRLRTGAERRLGDREAVARHG